MLARLMYGARVSLFIGIVAPFFYVLLGILYGSAAGFVGGRVDQVLMRFADFVIALPFLLFMILFKIAFGIGPGESGIVPMLVALVLLSWPGTARLVRGQILQIREEAYISASRLLGAQTGYLILRHMIPNTLGVILVTLTFAVPARDLHRGVPVVHRHGRRAADAVVGQHVQRRHQDDADASARADFPRRCSSRSRCWRSTCSATACATRSTCA